MFKFVCLNLESVTEQTHDKGELRCLCVYIATKWVLFCKRVVRNSTIYIVIGDEREMCRRVDLRNLYMKSVSVACCVCVSDFV